MSLPSSYTVYTHRNVIRCIYTQNCMQPKLRAIMWRCNCYSCHRFFFSVLFHVVLFSSSLVICVCVCVCLCFCLSGNYHYYILYPINMANPANYPYFVRCARWLALVGWFCSKNPLHESSNKCSFKSVFMSFPVCFCLCFCVSLWFSLWREQSQVESVSFDTTPFYLTS